MRNDAVALVRRRKRNFSHAQAQEPTADPQVLQVVGEIAADSFAADAIVLAAADVIEHAAQSVEDRLPDSTLAERAQIASAQAKVAIDRFAHATASRLFDVGGASATQSVYNLDLRVARPRLGFDRIVPVCGTKFGAVDTTTE